MNLEEANKKYREGDYSETVLRSIENYYRNRKDVWIEDLTKKVIQPRLDWLIKQVNKFTTDAEILDVGSWTGALANELSFRNYGSIDCLEICEQACDLGRETFPNLNFINESLYKFETDKKYDIIVMAEILEHLHKPLDVIEKFRRMLKKDGVLLITVPTPETTYRDGDSEHINTITMNDLEIGKWDIDTISIDNWEWYVATISNKPVYKVKDSWTFHLLGFPNYKTGWLSAPNNPFNTKLIYLAKMLKNLGHTVIHYGVEGSDIPYVDEHVTVVSESTFQKEYGKRNQNDLDNLHEEAGPAFEEFNKNAIHKIKERIKDPGKEFLINFLGYVYREITNVFEKDLICVEPGIGHNGSYLTNRIFESYAWQNHVYGKEAKPRESFFPNNYDTVIPAYFDPADYPFTDKKSDYYLYIGRIIWGKGVSVAIDITKRLGAKLIIIGGGDIKSALPPYYKGTYDHVEQLGVLSMKDKVKYLSNARALIYFSLYVEPFGHAPVEAMMCGTPVITSDFGAFTETNVHGLTGYRTNTFGELYWAAKNVDKLDNSKIREYAVNNYGLDRVKHKFQNQFKKLLGLRTGSGWYDIDTNNPLDLEHLTKYIPC